MAVSCLFAFYISPLLWCVALEMRLLSGPAVEADWLVGTWTLQAVVGFLLFWCVWAALPVPWPSACTLAACRRCEVKMAEAVRECLPGTALLWAGPRSARVSQKLQHLRLWEPYLQASFHPREDFLREGEVSDQEAMLILSMKVFPWHEKTVGILAFSPPALPSSHL